MLKQRLAKLVLVLVVFCFALSSAIAFAEVVDKVLAVVNDEVITQREYDRVYIPIKKNFEKNFQGEELTKRLNKVQKDVMEQLINAKLILSLAKEDDIKIDEAELAKRIDTIKSFYPTEEEFLVALSVKGTNLTEFEREIREHMLSQKYVEKNVASKINITPHEVKELYEKNKDQLIAPEAVQVRGIMIKKKADSKKGADRKQAEAILEKLNQGEDFAAVAKEYSEGPYASEGGEMGLVIRGQTLEEIDKVIFNLDKGQHSGIVETEIGYHIFLVEDKKEPRPMEFEEVSDFLRDQLFRRQFQQELQKFIMEQRKDAYISKK